MPIARLRRAVRWLAFLTGALVLLLTIGFLSLQTNWFRNWLRGQAVSRSAALLNGQLTIGKLSGSLWRGVTLDDVAFAQNGQPVFTAARIDVAYDPWVLAKRNLIFDSIQIQHLKVNAVQDASGWNVARITRPPAQPSAPKKFLIRHLGVTDGDVMLRPLTAAPRHFANLALDSSLVQADAGLEMAIDRLTLADERSGFVIRELSGKTARSFALIDLTFVAESIDSKIGGTLRSDAQPASRTIDADVDVTHFDAASILEDSRWTTDVTGAATVHAALATGQPAEVSFAFRGPHASGFGYQAADVDATGRVSAGAVTFDAKATAYGARASMKGAWHAGAGDSPSRFTGDGVFANLDLRRVPADLPIPAVATRLAGRYSVRMAGGVWSADLKLGPSEAAGARIGDGTYGHLEVTASDVRYAAQGSLAGLDLQQLAAPLELPSLAPQRFHSQLTGDFYIAGHGKTARDRFIAGGATLRASTMGATHMPLLSAAMTMTGRRLAIDAHGNFERLDAPAIGAPGSVALDLNGSVDGRVVFRNLDMPIGPETVDIDGKVVLGDSVVEGVEIQQALVEGTIADGFAVIRTLTADGPAAHLQAAGRLALGEAGESAVTLSVDLASVAVAGARTNQPLSGGAHVEATITGPSTLLTATGSLSGHQLAYGTTVSALTLNSTFTATVPDRQLARATVDATTAATFVTVGGMEMLRVSATSKYADRQIELDGRIEEQKRTLDLAGVLTFEPEARAVEFSRLALATAGTEWRLPDGQRATVRYGQDRVKVEGLVLTSQDQRVEAQGDLVISADGGSAGSGIDLTLANVQVADLNRLLLGTRQLGGVMNGTARVSGALKTPVVEAQLTVADGTVENVHFDSLSAKVGSTGARLAIDATLDQTAATRLTAKGSVPFALGAPGADAGEIDVRVQSNGIALGLVQMFTTEIDQVVGSATVDMHVTGPLKAPSVDGTVLLADGGFTVGATGVAYQGLNASLGLRASRLTIESLRITDDDGHALTAEGGVDVISSEAGRSVDVRIMADGFHVLKNAVGDIALDADLHASGTIAAPKIEGSITVDKGRLEVDQVLERTTKNPYRTAPIEDPTITVASAADVPPPAAPAAGLFEQAEIHVRVNFPGNLVLRGRDMRLASSTVSLGDMNVIAGGSFDVQKAAGAAIGAQGSVEILRGYYSFQGKRFEVQRGSDVRFRGNQLTNPTLQLTAEREVSGVTAEVQIRGTARNPRIALSSRPPLDESDILSLIIFDRPVNDLGSAERVSLAERAGALAAGALASPLAESVARALNLDVFEIQTGSASGSSPAVSLGSQIGTRLFVGLKQEFGSADSSTVSLEYRINNLLRLVTSVAYGTLQAHTTRRNEAGGFDLIYVIRY